MKTLANALVDNRHKLERVVRQLNLAGKKGDYSQLDNDGKPKMVSCLEFVRYGIGGVTFADVALLLEDTKQLDGRVK